MKRLILVVLMLAVMVSSSHALVGDTFYQAGSSMANKETDCYVYYRGSQETDARLIFSDGQSVSTRMNVNTHIYRAKSRADKNGTFAVRLFYNAGTIQQFGLLCGDAFVPDYASGTVGF